MATDTSFFNDRQPGGGQLIVDRGFHAGAVYFVDSNVDATNGRSPLTAVGTLDEAMALCTASNGDTVFVMPGHAETIDSVTCDVADVTIIGLGQGDNRPTLTFDDTTDEINVTADNVTIRGLRCISDVNSLVNFIDADASYLVVEDCEFITSSTKEVLAVINFATTQDYLTVRGCLGLQPSDPEGTDQAAGTGFLYIVDTENVTFENNTILGSYETAIIHNLTTKVQNLYMRNNTLRQDLSTALLIEIVAGATGSSRGDDGHNINADDATAAKMIGTYGTLFWFGPDSYFSNDSGGGGQGMIASETATT